MVYCHYFGQGQKQWEQDAPMKRRCSSPSTITRAGLPLVLGTKLYIAIH
ncbi:MULTISPECIES: hypothetical protein [Okeania]|nr:MULTISPECIES: hypothetical protein [Okeania]NEP04082.1 hypothetical protein [Okeania sp. SIO4D6]NET17955.1 hypothetical protein [Okeania sp. SIO1H5]NEP70852.1 hypothetical protein [Okeania sp. SIO2G5]NEP92369.1 hypothetical protein [Okeania sp. SIO2F5]NEQ89903.1 hypothetical protein [Okeania sp. SIO2G4]